MSVEEHLRTHGQDTTMVSGAHDQSRVSFEEEVAAFYAQLSARQEPLGKEFEQVLWDNFDALIVRT